MAAATREVGAKDVVGTRQGTIRDRVPVDVPVTLKVPDAVEVFPRSIPCRDRCLRVGYSNWSDIQLFIPRSRSLMTNTGVWRRSARSKASIDIVKHSSIVARYENDMFRVAMRKER